MSASENAPWKGKSILIVDDYPAVRRAIKDIIVGLGMKAEEAENGLEAQAVLKKEKFDMVISDLVMPEMDGFELTEALRNTPEYRRLPVVIISTHDDAKYIFRALHLGADDYIIKPPSAEMVKTVLARIFDHDW
ncbi:MAG: response regulator [Planctomycetes bacterium]|nr:response regulator [Planctomycetota bacterium]MCD7897404.1 response regulator [Planctomycetaceae bacterium]